MYLCIYMYIYMYLCIYISVHICIYIYIYTHIYTHTHIYICRAAFVLSSIRTDILGVRVTSGVSQILKTIDM